jgi:hypothetical protein
MGDLEVMHARRDAPANVPGIGAALRAFADIDTQRCSAYQDIAYQDIAG